MNVADIDKIISEILNDKPLNGGEVNGGRYARDRRMSSVPKHLRAHHSKVMKKYRELKKKESGKRSKTPGNKLLMKAMKLTKKRSGARRSK